MPELPEVTTVIGILKQEVLNKTIINVDILHENIIKTDLNNFTNNLKNKTIENITRLGKYIIFHLSDEKILISHLRMEGKYSLLEENDNLPKHSCVIFHLNTNQRLVYHDTRKFGVMHLLNKENYLKEPPLNIVGPEPMSLLDQKSRENIYKKLNKKKKIKELLLDQTIMSGIGNIYADEILFASLINPNTFGNSLSISQYDLIIENSIKILERAIELGGSTIKSYHPKEGMSGLFQIELRAYGRKGQPCPNCGTTFKKIFLNGRGTTFCPNCQIDENLKKAIAITGSIGAGKSSVLKIFNELGFYTASSDEIVANLYKEDSIKRKIKKLFGEKALTENNEIDTQYIRNEINKNEILQEQLEKLIFPEVEKVIVSIIETHEKPIIEVPLLEKAKLQYLFKKIIYVDANRDLRIRRISSSRPYDGKKAVELFEKNNQKSLQNLIIFENNSTNLEELKNEIITNLIYKV